MYYILYFVAITYRCWVHLRFTFGGGCRGNITSKVLYRCGTPGGIVSARENQNRGNDRQEKGLNIIIYRRHLQLRRRRWP